MHVFTSTYHPGSASRSLVFGRWFVRPLAMTLLPLMIATLIAALQGYPILGFLYYGFPSAMLLAWLWTWHVVRTTLATIYVRQDAVATQTVWQAAAHLAPDWEQLFDVRRAKHDVTLTIGLRSYDLNLREWSNAETLMQALIDIRHATRYAGAVPR